MNKLELEEIQLIGLALKTKTFNANGQSAIDCGNLWQDFTNGNYAGKIPGKLNSDILAVYHQYEGDHTKPYSYFIGCKVNANTPVPPGMDSLNIPAAQYQKILIVWQTHGEQYGNPICPGHTSSILNCTMKEVKTGAIPKLIFLLG